MMRTDIEIVTPPPADQALEIVAVVEMRKHLRMTSTALDDVIESALRSAVAHLDGLNGVLNRSVLTYAWRAYRPAFPPGRVMRLPYPPLITVSAVEYLDSNEDEQTLDSDRYVVRKPASMPGEIQLIGAAHWPTTSPHPRAVSVTFTAGYGIAGGSPPVTYPEALKRAVKFLAAHYVRNTGPDSGPAIPFGLNDLIAALRVPHEYGESHA